MIIKPFPLVVALLPLAIYLLMLGLLRVARRPPLVTSGARDAAGVALAISGLVVVGPMELFFPSNAAALLGWWVWPMLGVLYALCVTLVVILQRPRLVIYGVGSEQLIQPLLEAAQQIDPAARREPDQPQVVLPTLQLRLRVEEYGARDLAQVVAFESNRSPLLWNRLLAELRRSTASLRTQPSRGGLLMLLAGVILAGVILTVMVLAPAELLAGFRQWLRL